MAANGQSVFFFFFLNALYLINGLVLVESPLIAIRPEI